MLVSAIAGDREVGVNDVCWRDSAPSWEPVDARVVGSTVSSLVAVCKQQNERIFFATLVNPHDMAVVAVPAQHRQLWPGETVRRGDKFLEAGMNQWHEVSDQLGTVVDNSGEVRYCRPTSPQAQNWYVKDGAGGTGLGGPEDPFPSLAVAQERIEKAGAAAGITPYGIVWSTEGVPLMCYDIPEPEGRPQFPDSEGFLAQENEPKQETGRRGTAKQLAEHWMLEEQEAVDSAMQDCNSKYRQMVAGEETRATDLWYGPFNDDWDSLMWQPCPADLVGLDPGVSGYIFARKQAPTQKAGVIESRLNEVEEQLEAALATIRDLRKELLHGQQGTTVD